MIRIGERATLKNPPITGKIITVVGVSWAQSGSITAHCDFCSRPFTPVAFNQRTCVACEAAGAPDQSKPGYEAALVSYFRRREAMERIAQKRMAVGGRKTRAYATRRSSRVEIANPRAPQRR